MEAYLHLFDLVDLGLSGLSFCKGQLPPQRLAFGSEFLFSRSHSLHQVILALSLCGTAINTGIVEQEYILLVNQIQA